MHTIYTILLSHHSPSSYYYRITDEYMGIMAILGLMAIFIFSTQAGYFSYLLTHIFHFPDVVRSRMTPKGENESTNMVKLLNLVLMMGTVALAILLLMKPYEGIRLPQLKVLYTDNYLLWFGMLLGLMSLALIRQLVLEISIRFIPGTAVLRDWKDNTLNAAFLSSFVLLGLCFLYILGYFSVSTFQYLLIIFLVISLIFRAIISFAASGRFNFTGKLNFFLYLCTLEILPALVGAKFVIDILN